MSGELPVDPAMVNARVTVTIETDATETSPATRTTVTMPRVEQVHATPLMQIVGRPSTILMPPGQLSAMVLRFDLAPGLAQVQMHTERMMVTGVRLPGRVAEPEDGTLGDDGVATCRHCWQNIVRPENGIWYHHDVAGPRVCE